MALINQLAPNLTQLAQNNYAKNNAAVAAPTQLSQGMSIDPSKLYNVSDPYQTTGIKAVAPEQKQTTVNTNTIKPSQTQTNTATATPKTFTNEQNQGLLAALARQKSGTASKADNDNLSYAQKNGWKAPAATTATTAANSNVTNTNEPTVDISNPGLIKQEVTAATNTPEVTQKAETGLLNTASQNQGTSGVAYTDYQNAIKELADFKTQLASANAGLGMAGNSLQATTGEQQNLQTKNADILAALQNKVNEKAAAIGYQISGAQTQQSGYQQAGTMGQTGQQIAVSGLGTAVNQTQPVQVQYGTPLVNPQTGQNINMTASGVSDKDPFYATMKTYANLLANNQGSSVPSSITGNAVLNAQLINMAKAINPNFNVNVAAGTGGAQASVAASQTSQIQGYQSALQQGQNLKTQLNDLINTFGLNPSDINAANTGLQKIAQNVSSPQYKMLQNYINDIANTYAQILTPSGGSQTDTTRGIAASMLDSTMSGRGIMIVMDSLDEAAKAKIAGVGTSAGAGTGAGQFGGNTISTGGYTYELQNGKWVVKK